MRRLFFVWLLFIAFSPIQLHAAEESRNYPLGPIGGQFRISGGEAYAKIVSLEPGAPGVVAGLQRDDLIIGVFGKPFTPTGSFHYGVTQELGFAVDRAQGSGGQLPLRVLRPGVGALDITVNLPATHAFSPAYPRNDAKSKQLYESGVAWLHNSVMGSNGDRGYFTGWTGLALLSHEHWNSTTGPKPYRLSINKIRDYVVNEINTATFAPVEDKLIDGSANPNHATQGNPISNWQLGQKVMFLAEYYVKSNDQSIVATLQRGAEMCANTVQWWKQPALAGNGYSPNSDQIAGMVSHGGVTGDYIHLGWGGGINMTGVYSYNGMAFARSAGMNMASRPRDGHYFGFTECPAGVVPAGKENYDPTIDEKFLMQTNWMVNRCGAFGSGDEDGHICYTLQGWSSWDAGGRTPATLLGLAMYQRDGGILDANYLDRLERMKGYITRQYMKHQEAHAYCVGAQAYQQFAAAFLSDRQQRFFMDNWRFYYALSQTPNGGFQYFRSRGVDDSYLDETYCAALNAALPYAVANGGLSLVPAYKTERLLVNFENPEITWPSLPARAVTVSGATLPMPVSVVNGDGELVPPANYTATWTQLSGNGTVAFGPSELTFPASGKYRVQLTVTDGTYTVVEPIEVSVQLFPSPSGYQLGAANYQVYTGIGGSSVADLTNAAKFPNQPDIVRTVAKAAGDYSGNSYGARLSGAIMPPVTGIYRFYVAADDSAQLSINASGLNPTGASVIARVSKWTNLNQWNKYPEQQSAAISLSAGQAIWFEALHKEDSVGDHLSIGWSINGGPIEVIDGAYLATPVPPSGTMAFVSQPSSQSLAPGETLTLQVTTTGPAPALYQWRRNGRPIGSASSSSTLTVNNVSGGAAGEYDVILTTPVGALTSEAASVRITDTGSLVTGGLWREFYSDLGGNQIADLTGSWKFPNFSDASGPIASAATSSSGTNRYGQRWTGWITPTTTGLYRFYLASDDDSELWLGSNELPASASRIARVSGFTGEKTWLDRGASGWVSLTAGSRYYVEVLHKDGGGGNHCALAWQRQGTAKPANGANEIPGSFFSYRTGGIYRDLPIGNSPPEFLTEVILGLRAFAGNAYTSTLAEFASDPDTGDLLTFSRVSGPAWLAVASSGEISGTPTLADIGSNQWTVRVTDREGLTAETSLSIEVAAANAPPVFENNRLFYPSAFALAPYAGQSLATSATDADGDLLTFAKLNGPAWLEISSDGTLSGTPSRADLGENRFSVRVTDLVGGADEAELVIVVQEARFFFDVNGMAAGSGATSGATWNDSAQWTTDQHGVAATFPWTSGAMAVFSAGSDAASEYTIDNQTVRGISGFVARSGRPYIVGSALQVLNDLTVFEVGSTALGAQIDVPLSGFGGIEKTGPGTLVLGGKNTFTKDVTVSDGVLEMTAGAKLYDAAHTTTATLVIRAGGTWRLPNYSYAGIGKHSDYRQRRVLQGGSLEVTGSSHSSGQDFTVTSAGGTFRYTPPGQTLTLAGNTNTDIQTSGPLVFDTLGHITLAGVSSMIEGSGSIVKTGPANLTFANGGNRFAGDLTVESGKLIATATSSSQGTALGLRSGSRNLIVHAEGAMEWTINNVLGGKALNASSLPKVTLNGGSLTTTRYNILGHLSLAGGKLINATNGDPISYDGYQLLGSVTALGEEPSALTTTNSRGNHLLGGGSNEFAVISEAGQLTVATVLHNGSEDYPGIGSLRKTGQGRLSLTAANLFTGTTTIEAGVLELSGSLASATTVADSGTLSGSGTITATVTVKNGGTISPTSMLTTGALTLENGATLLADGTLTVNGDLALAQANWVITTPSPRTLVSFTGVRTGEFSQDATPDGWQLEYDDAAGEIRLVETAEAGENFASWIAGFATEGKSAWNDDADGDGISNALEFLLGGDPLIPNTASLPLLEKSPNGDFTYRFQRAARARGHSVIVALLSDDLITWPVERAIMIGESSGPGVEITAQEDHDEISVTISGNTPKTFVRLEVSPTE